MKKHKIKLLILKGMTNDKCPAKQYCYVTEDKKKDYEKALIIRKLILVNKSDLLDYMMTGHAVLKKFKNNVLLQKTFSIKLSTLENINNWLITK